MNIIRHSNQWTEEYRESCIEGYELRITADFKRSDDGGYSGTSWELEVDRDCYIDDAQNGNYAAVYEDLDSFLQEKNIVVEYKSDEYLLLAKKFLDARIEALYTAQELLNGGSYTYKNNKDISQISIPSSHTNTSEERASTTNKRNAINVIAARLREKYPSVAKYILADDISKELEKKHGIVVSGKTILRHYSTHF